MSKPRVANVARQSVVHQSAPVRLRTNCAVQARCPSTHHGPARAERLGAHPEALSVAEYSFDRDGNKPEGKVNDAIERAVMDFSS